MKHSVPILCVSLALLTSSAAARLPTPAATPEAQAKAAEAAARTAWVGKTDNYMLCVAQDKVAAKYRASATSAGKTVPAATATPPCTDPGPFVYAAAEPAKPLEAAGAHSPPATAASPPSTTTPAAATNPTPKP
ncbi:hypothetical protein WKW79_16510 [Variovorax robiniae]|uniref:Uncharacterized protein n=1 Tax=Variovorax robiniae TaxID=1836199 RepID=A0ABU8X906_9BURK